MVGFWRGRRCKFDHVGGVPGAAAVVPEAEADGLDGPGGEDGGEFGQQALGNGRIDLVLDGDVGAVALRILRGQRVSPFPRQAGSELEEGFGFEGECDAAAERLQAGDADGEGRDDGGLRQVGGDGAAVDAG